MKVIAKWITQNKQTKSLKAAILAHHIALVVNNILAQVKIYSTTLPEARIAVQSSR